MLDDVVERVPIGEHDGRSGGLLERVRLADGRRLVVKRVAPVHDVAALMTGDDGREVRLFRDGVLDRLPPGVGHAIVDAWHEDDGWVLVMRDVSAGLVRNDRVATRAEVSRVMGAATALHGAFRGDEVPGLCPLPAALAVMGPGLVPAAHATGSPLGELVQRGWERFGEVVPGDVSAGVAAMHADPDGLAARFRRWESTLLHGDLWMVNLSLLPDEVVLLDWALATWAPPAVELATFLLGHGSRMEPSREEVVAGFAARSGDLHDDGALSLALAWGLSYLGWNKALDVTEHADPAKRAAEQEDLDWWVARFRAAGEQGVLS